MPRAALSIRTLTYGTGELKVEIVDAPTLYQRLVELRGKHPVEKMGDGWVSTWHALDLEWKPNGDKTYTLVWIRVPVSWQTEDPLAMTLADLFCLRWTRGAREIHRNRKQLSEFDRFSRRLDV